MRKYKNIKSLRMRWREPDAEVDRNVKILLRSVARQEAITDLDLRGASLGMPDTPDYLLPVVLSNCHLENIDLSHSKISESLHHSWICNTKFSGCTFDRCRFNSAIIKNCGFDRARFICPWLEDTQFEGCNFSHAIINGGAKNILNESGSRISFTGCNFTGATIKNLKIRGVDFVDNIFTDCSFENSLIFNWRFRGGHPDRACVSRCEYYGKNVGLPWLTSGN